MGSESAYVSNVSVTLRARKYPGAVDVLSAKYGLPSVSWTDPPLVARTTQVKATHLAELRTAVEAIHSAASPTALT